MGSKRVAVLVNYKTEKTVMTFSRPGNKYYDSLLKEGYVFQGSVYGFDLSGAKKANETRKPEKKPGKYGMVACW